jgi:4-amino-4-deoxy-L-arabinose transferase-like glycosyltransferase
MTDHRWYRSPPLLVLLLAAATTAFLLGSRGLWDPDEGRFTNVALQMLASGEYLSLYRHPETLHFTKPPVTYWAIAASVAALGWNEWAVRLPGALAHLGIVALLLRIGGHFAPRRPWLPALVYACLPVPVLAAFVVTTDTPLAFATTLAFACYVIARFEGRPRFLLGMWAAFGLAFLTKGPPALLILAGIALFHHRQGAGPRFWPPVGLLLFALVGLAWYGVVVARHDGLLGYFLGYEVYARIATDTHDRFPEWWGGFFVYGLTLGLGTLPFWPWALAAWRRGGAGLRVAAPETRLLLHCLGLALLVFLLARSRLPLYVLPLFPLLALLFGRALQDQRFGRGRTAAIAAVVAGAMLVKAGSTHLDVIAGWLPEKQAAKVPLHKDARRWARAFEVLAPFPIEEVVFVSDMARYALRLYLQAPVEKVEFDGDPSAKPLSDAPFDDLLGKELRESGEPGGRIFVMREASTPRFEDEVRAAGWEPQRLGEVRDRVVYALARPGDSGG